MRWVCGRVEDPLDMVSRDTDGMTPSLRPPVSGCYLRKSSIPAIESGLDPASFLCDSLLYFPSPRTKVRTAESDAELVKNARG